MACLGFLCGTAHLFYYDLGLLGLSRFYLTQSFLGTVTIVCAILLVAAEYLRYKDGLMDAK